MRRRLAIFTVIGATLAALAVGGIGVLSASAGEENVTICHSTSSETNPYNEITVDENSIANVILGMNGHATHTGGIFPEPGWGDIIPAFNIPPNSFGGLNNSAEGLAILENGCVPPGFVPPGPPPPPGPEVPAGPEAPVPVEAEASFTG